MAKTTVGELVYKISGDAKGLGATLSKTEAKVHGLGAAFDKVNHSKVAMITAGTAAFAAFAGTLVSATKKAAKFESRIGDIRTLIGDDAAGVNEMRDGILDLTESIPKSADELGAASYHILSAGITDTTEALQVLEQSSKLAVAGLGNTTEAVDLMTGAYNAFKNQNISTDRIANIFFETVRQGKTTVSELAQSFGTVAPIASTLGIELAELQAATAALTTGSIKTSEAQTALRAAMNSLMKPSEEMKRLLAEIGVETGRTLVEQEGFVGALREIKEAANGNDEVLAKAMGRIRGLSAVLSLTGEQGEAFNRILEDMESGSVNLEKAFGRQAETTENQLQVAQNRMNVLLIDLGTKILPVVNDALEGTLSLLDSWDAPNKSTEDFIKKTKTLTEQQNILEAELEKVKEGTSEFSLENIKAANSALQLQQEEAELEKKLELTRQAQEGGIIESRRAKKALEEYGEEVYTAGLNLDYMMTEELKLSLIESRLKKDLDNTNKSLSEKEEALEAILSPYRQIHEEMNKTDEAAEEEAKAIQEAEDKLSSFRGEMLSFIESAKKTSKELQGDLKDSFEEFGDSLKNTFKETDQELASIVVDTEENIDKLKDKLKEERQADDRDNDRIRELRDEIKEEEEILETSAGYEERRAERIEKIRGQLTEAGIKPEAIGLEDLQQVQTLEERITEERRMRDMNEFERFEEQQFKKIEILTQNFITETQMTIEKIITQKKYEQELTDFLVETNEVRTEAIDKWAENAVKKYGTVAEELKSVISQQQRLNNLRGGGDNKEQYYKGGFVGAGGGDTHFGEYVIPTHMVQGMSGLVSNLEKIRTGQSITENYNTNNQINQDIKVEEQADFDLINQRLSWQLGSK